MLARRIAAVNNLLGRPRLASDTVSVNEGIASGSFGDNTFQRPPDLPRCLLRDHFAHELRFDFFNGLPGFGLIQALATWARKGGRR